MPRVATLTPNGPAVRALRVRRGLSTTQVGKMVGRHAQTIRNVELAKTAASELLMYQIANAFKVDITEITVAEDKASPADSEGETEADEKAGVAA